MADSIRHAGRWTLEDRFASPWHYLPVEVGPGAAGLRVELEYEQADGAVLDLGCLGPGGFRGWSGGARAWFAITGDAATPGYLPGEIEHVRRQARMQQYRRINLLGGSKGLGLVENGREHIEVDFENREGSVGH